MPPPSFTVPRILFLDEPFEGVDAIAAGTLKNMLQRMIARGCTIFLTSHVLEIVERLCSHIAIIDRGHLIAQGSLEELRAGTKPLQTTTNGNSSSHHLTLEEIFIQIVGNQQSPSAPTTAVPPPPKELSWLA